MASMSRWFVGSSSSSTSGWPTSARASRALRRQPPDSVSTRVSAGRPRRDRTISTRCSSRQPSRSSRSWWSVPSRSRASGERSLRHLDRGVVVGGHQRAEIPETLRDDVEHRLVGRDGDVLLEPREPDARLPGDGSAVHGLFAADDAQQRGLAGAVPPEHAHAFPRVDRRASHRREAGRGRRRASRGRARRAARPQRTTNRTAQSDGRRECGTTPRTPRDAGVRGRAAMLG